MNFCYNSYRARDLCDDKSNKSYDKALTRGQPNVTANEVDAKVTMV